MPSERVNRMLAQKAKLQSSHRIGSFENPPEPDSVAVNALVVEDPPAHFVLNSIRASHASELAEITTAAPVDEIEVTRLVKKLRSAWDQEQLELLLANCRRSVLASIAGPFGLGRFVAKFDHDGGNVTTIRNAKLGVYAKDDDKYRRGEYAGSKFETAKAEYKSEAIQPNSQMIRDEYSGESYDYSVMDCDHIVPLEAHHQAGGFMTDQEKKALFGAHQANFAMTHRSSNRSRGSKHHSDWQRIEATDGSGQSNKKKFQHDNRRVRPRLEQAEWVSNNHLPDDLEKAIYYAKNTAATGGIEAGKMGLQQALGLLLTEFFSAAFDEIVDTYRNGLREGQTDKSFFQALKKRLAKISSRVESQWKFSLTAFKEGAISAFLSNLVTTLINMVMQTGKRLVRIIREGLMSILRALKMALFPPLGMSRAEAADTAMKLLITGAMTGIGIMLEEVVEAFPSSLLPGMPVAMLAGVIVGAMTGIGTALLIYGVDRLDLFLVNADRKHTGVLQFLDNVIENTDRNINGKIADVMNQTDILLLRLRGGG